MMKVVRSELFMVYLFCAAFGLWACYDVISWLVAEQATVGSRWPQPVGIGAAFVGITALMVLASWFFPLVNATLEDWQYKIRASGRLRWFGIFQGLQLLVCAFLGAAIGAAQGILIGGVVWALVLRLALQFLHKRDLPTYLRSVRRNVLARTSFFILDANLVSELLVSSHLKWRPSESTDNFWVLVFRRFWRRPYLPVSGLACIALTIATGDVFGRYGVVIFFVVWTMVGTALMRCADFSKLGVEHPERFVLLGAHAVAGLLLLLFTFPISHSLIVAVLFIPAVMWGGFHRSKSRIVEKITFVDSGMAGLVSPELVAYYSAGLELVIILGAIAAGVAV